MEEYWEICELTILKRELEKYKSVLSREVYEYFNSLLNLDLSVVDNSISEDERILISFLPFYKSVVKYNIYNKAISLLSENSIKLQKVNDYREQKVILTSDMKLRNSPRMINVLNLSIDRNNDLVLEIFNSLSDPKTREQEIDRINGEIKSINKRIDEISSEIRRGLFDDSMVWNLGFHNYDTSKRDDGDYLERYERALKKINSLGDLTKNDIEEINTAGRIYELIMSSFGLDEDDFSYDKTDYIMGASHKYMDKVKIVTKGNVRIISNNYYL